MTDTSKIAHEVKFAADQAFLSGNISGVCVGGGIVMAAYEGFLWGMLIAALGIVGAFLWQQDRRWP